MDEIYKDFKKSLKNMEPDLGRVNFGFTLDSKGDLVATGVSGQQKTKLAQLLNQSPGMKDLASEFASAVMNYAQATGYDILGKYRLNIDTFQDAVDIGRALNALHEKSNQTGNWFYQIYSKGQIDDEGQKAVRVS